jgi:hypothetical protein
LINSLFKAKIGGYMPKTSTTFKKGEGRPKGSENKTTRDIKEAYKMLIENNLDNLTNWLIQVAKKDPAKAIYIISDLSEYVIPKLARQEHTGKDGDPIQSETIVKLDLTKLSDAALREIANAARPEGGKD